MTSLAEAQPRETPFTDAAQFYAPFRPPYAPEALDHAAARLGLTRESRVLDLGCGPGTLSLPLSRRVGEVVAVDIDPRMLACARDAAAEADAGPIRWIESAAEDLPPDLGTFGAAVLGQSLHWMDRDRVLARLGGLVEPGGGIAIFDQTRPEAWEAIARPLVVKYLGPRPARHPRASQEMAHAPALARSAWFGEFESAVFESRMVRDLPSVLGYLNSATGSSRLLFGDRLEAFQAELAAALAAHYPDGRFESVLETRVIVALKRAG